MNPEEIKVGDKVLVEAVVTKKYHDGDFQCTTQYKAYDGGIDETKFDVLCSLAHKMTDTHANGIKNAEPAPKYDPNRPFREGDIVTPCSVKGRWLDSTYKERVGILFTVTKDEDEDGIIWVKDPDRIHQDCGDCVYFQLVTPVEEQELYSVRDSAPISGFDIMRAKMLVMTFPYGPKEAGYYRNELAAKAAAEAECARLNAEHRKEQE